jgi:hypothetical protein
MDKVGYKKYLQSLGNQNHYIGGIQKLVEIEQELNIDFDDYIPYNEDYSKAGKLLDEILPEKIRYNEPIIFSINSYMRYRLSGFDATKEHEKSENIICDDYFTFNGTASELKQKLSTFMSEENSQIFIENFKSFTKNLGEDEFVKEIMSIPKSQSNPDMIYRSYLLTPRYSYNINIKAVTLTTIALLLDIQLTLGFMSAMLAITGFNNQAIVKVDVSEGEICLILEAMQSKNRIINEDVFANCNSECIHNDLECKYRNSDDKCTIKKEDIKRILDELCEKNIFKKIKNLYKYNF